MNIKAETTYNFENIKRHYYFDYFNGNIASAAMFYAVTLFICVFSAIELVKNYHPMWIIFIIAMLVYCGYVTFKPHLQNSSRGVMYNLKNTFYFDTNSFTFESSNSVYSGKSKVKYSNLYMVYETPKCFYIYITKKTRKKEAQAVMVEKSGITNGTPEKLSALLRKALPAKKYKVCKYWIF